MKYFLATLLALSSLFSQLVFAEPPFRSGEVVVSGSPSDFPFETVIKYLPHANLTVLATQPGAEKSAASTWRGKGKRAGRNFIATKQEVPNDPIYYLQWHFDAVQAEDAWDISKGTGVVVAVLDTGLNLYTSDGINCVIAGINIVNPSNPPADGDGHGTHVAGTIAQSTNNSIGVAGLANQACIMPVKVLSDTGSGSFADIADGIYYAIDNNAKVINMSLGINARYGVTNDSIMDLALDAAFAADITVVVASGNDGHRKNVSYPAIYPTTIAVGATDFRNSVTRYSNKGKGLDMVAPGGDNGRDDNNDGQPDGVLQETVISGSSAYYFFAGTSMASPHVAAAAAMLIAHDITDRDEIYQRLTTTTLDLGDSGYDKNSGHGLLQVHDALVNNTGSDPVTDPVTDPSTGTDNDGDGVTEEEGDCDDSNPDVYPGHKDKGKWGRDGIDNDCNDIIDG
ncbi:MAG: S8 family serine peptidase [Oleispira sp.]|nr:S8 family serine peptidase [Oleispira sp.]